MGGRAQEGIDEASRANQLDPLSPIMEYAQAEAYTADHQFNKAMEVAKKSITGNPEFGRAYTALALSYWGLRRYPEAIEAFKKSDQLQGDNIFPGLGAILESGFRSGGWPAALRKVIDAMAARRKESPTNVSSFRIARLYADLGDRDHAFEWLEVAYKEHDIWLIRLRTDFALDTLRSDARYAALVKKIGLPQ